jgi:putative endopeptidase
MTFRPVLSAFLLTLCSAFAEKAFDPTGMDPSVKPGDNFFQYANGTWIKNNPIPPEFATWGSFVELGEQNLSKLKTILESASTTPAPKGSIAQKLGDFYASGMDAEAINRAGVQPLQPEFDRITSLKSSRDLPALLAHLHEIGVDAGFGFGGSPDAKNSSLVIAQYGQSGLGLPDRDYYLLDTEPMKKIRAQYLTHVTTMFKLMGDKPEAAQAAANAVMKVETQLAEASMTRVQMRDPEATYHKMTLADVSKLTPDFDQSVYLQTLGLKDVGDICVGQPDFLKRFNKLVTTLPLPVWHAYLRWHLIHDNAGELSDAFVNESFAFYGTTLSGTKELKPRWKRVVGATSGCLGEGLGKLFVDKHFTPEAKQRSLELVNDLRATLRERLQNLEWMSPETKKAALNKLDKIIVKIGYPDEWRDYSKLDIDRSSYVLNTIRAAVFESHRDLAKIGKPVDRKEWFMTPQTVNAYYNPLFNEIVFPAGILQPPFFSATSDDAINYGGIGMVIGHEMTHGFDDKGRQFDSDGNLKNWWTDADKKAYDTRTGKIADQYSKLTVIDEIKLNPQLTLGENIADIGGLRIAWTALQKKWARAGKPQPIDGFTAEQRFFLGYAQVWRSSIRKETLRLRAQTDPHSPAIHRVNAVVANMPEFFSAFGCDPKTAALLPAGARADIW